MDQDIAAIAAQFRRFNRMYMGKLQPLRDVMRGPGLHASYVRVLRELGDSPSGATAASVAWRLNMSPALVCRILGWFRALGYLQETRDPKDGRRKIITLSPRGRRDYADSQRRVTSTAEFMLQLLPPGDLDRLVAAMTTIEAVLRDVRWDDITCRSSDPGCG